MYLPLFDTHTHFDIADFEHDRIELAQAAKKVGVEHLILIGIEAKGFDSLVTTHQQLNQLEHVPRAHLAPGLHPFYIEQHQQSDLQQLEQFLQQHACIAIGEIGLDTFLKQHKQPEVLQKQKIFFSAQIELAQHYQKPILLHIRKSHAEVLKMLKDQKFQGGGIAHAFGGGVEEAKAFIKLGFKLGITGQISNPNAKKLHSVVQAVGMQHLVLETDCPDMTPLCCQLNNSSHTRNTPANLVYVLQALAQSLQIAPHILAEQLWHNTQQALKIDLTV